jgi:hypothetical protein
MLIFRRPNFVIAGSGIVPLVKSGLRPLLTIALNDHLQSGTIPEPAIIKLGLLRMSMVILETCRGF